MSKTTLVTFATPRFYYAKATLLRSAAKFGIDQIHSYSGNDFKKTNFYKKHLSITAQTRGAGYWLWKPYYILQVLKSLTEGDILVYCDSGVDIIASLAPLLKIVSGNEKGIVLFENYQGSSYFSKTKGLEINEYNLYKEVNKNKYWTKRDAFVLMDLNNEIYWNSPLLDANFQVYRACGTSISFVQNWLNYCCDERILTDTPNQFGPSDVLNFFGHIHDQAIISLLAAKDGLEIFRAPSQYGNHYKMPEFREEFEYLLLPYASNPKVNSFYGTLLNHHRIKFPPFATRWKNFIAQEIKLLWASINR